MSINGFFFQLPGSFSLQRDEDGVCTDMGAVMLLLNLGMLVTV